jgi:hypothetical protein
MQAHRLPVATDLTDPARAVICNGMGPKAGYGFLSRVFCKAIWLFLRCIGVGLLFDACGDDHDLHYAMGGTESDRAYADLIFLGNMLEVSRRLPWLVVPMGNLMAVLCYTGVREGGGLGPFKYRPSGKWNLAQVLEDLGNA